MARIPTIISRESPLVGAPQSAATGEDFGAGIGRAVQGLGNTVQQIGSQVGAIGAQRQADADRFAVATALSNNTFTETYNDTVVNYDDPTGEGLPTTVMENYDKWKGDVLANSGLTGNALKELDLRLSQEKRMYGEKSANDAATMLGNSADARVKTGIANVINDVRNHGATGIPEFETAFNKGALVLQGMKGYDANHKEVGEAQLMSDMAGARFAALSDAAKTEEQIRGLQAELTSDYWQDKFSVAQNEQTRNYLEAASNAIKTESRAVVDATIIQMRDRLNDNVAIPDAEWQTGFETFKANAASMSPTQLEAFKTMTIQQNAIREKMGLPPAGINETESASALPAGTHSRIVYTNQHAIRNRPVTPQLSSVYGRSADAAGIDEIRVISGGQARAGEGPHTGSTRHDLGNAGDIQLVKDGRVLQMTNPNDLPTIIKFMQTAWSLGATGQGAGVAYMGSSTFHVGFGATAVWGGVSKKRSDGTVIPAPPPPAWLVAIRDGTPAGATPANGMAAYQTAIGNIETRGQAAPYQHVTPNGALGRYGIMRPNLAEWSTAALGRPISEAEFLANPALQDQIFNHRFGMYVKKYGPNLAAAAWFAGEKGMSNNAAMDILGTDVQEYINKFVTEMNGQTGTTPEGHPGPGVGMTQEDHIRQVVLDGIVADQQAAFNSGGFIDYIQTPNGGSVTVPPLDITSDAPAWLERQSIFETNKQKYALKQNQMAPLAPGEVAVFTDLMHTGDAAKQLAVLKGIANWTQENQEYAYTQLGGVDPIFAQAGRAMADGRGDTALAMLEGRKLTKTPDGLAMPWQEDANKSYQELTGNGQALAGIDTNIRAGMKGSVDAAYAYNTRMTNGEFDPVAYEKAIEQVTGMNLDEVNGVVTLLPPDLDSSVVETAMSVMDVEQWTDISEAKEPPIDKFGRPLEPWALEGASLFMVDDDGFYDVYVDGGKVMTEGGTPFRVQLVPGVIKQIAAEGVAAAVTMEGPQALPGLIIDPTLGGSVPPPPAPPANTDPTTGGLIVSPPSGPALPLTPARMKDDALIPRPPPVPNVSGTPDIMAGQAGQAWLETINLYRIGLEDAGLDDATVDRLVKEFDTQRRPEFIRQRQGKK